MKLTFTDTAKARLEKLAGTDKKIVLDFDDGVGPFSDEANCTLALSFNLLFVPKDTDLKEFGATIDSNMGTVYAKPYSLDQMDDEMKVDVNEKYLRYTLSGRNGVLDPALGIKSL
ncbi:iron-sulfur cluster biosynthesis family protein [Fructobacillus parabroussonetiae]|uniref:Iron-sulfur cluster biosynthesis family protein n=1 Tax=Fructobacillus parabroussonetiae TaxID=2713174 RepID=A0ABS5QX79_9LACO|nr:iron-sulfur cluster biosynthesis family protein [Fructobacillus parabroussonetiae]MBS9336884.1 iron-sulfur cluster biosynthesis family protein [Fructobacillus parabroussonetiae]MCK8617508.1 iron-sulfur cluster biosynthesis family protein [Fructobacillus parabroussonetiae]